ncbi:MAG: hypothetical protein WBB19_02140 [Desulforhopalus sp.]
MKTNILSFIALVFIIGTGNVYADETIICADGQQERIISIMYYDQDAKVPCDVEYTKNGQTEILWHAENEVGYCEEKAEEFTQKLTALGWQCGNNQ